MRRASAYDACESGFDALARAIVIQAAEDYKKYRFVLDTLDMRSYKTYEGKRSAKLIAERQVGSAISFLKSDWFEELSSLNGAKALKALEKTYLKEYYPARMEEWEETNVRAKGFIREAKERP